MGPARETRREVLGSGASVSRMSATDAARDDADLAARLASGAGERLLQVRAGGLEGAALRAEGDRVAHDLLLAALAEQRPADAVLSEEGRGEHGRAGVGRLDADRVWIVDPLDGTREFGEPPREDWAVHVALWERGADPGEGPAADPAGRLTAGAVALPALGLTLHTGVPPALPEVERRPRLAVSRSRPPAVAERIAAALGAELVPMGSAGAKAMSVVRGLADAYVHDGGQFEWDSAAPVAVARASGLHASRLDGSPLRYNRPDVSLPDLLVCRPELAAAILALT